MNFRLTGLTARDFEASGGNWEPHAHFTGQLNEIASVQKIVDRHAENVVAYYDYCPFPGMFSLELQFKTKEQGVACRQDYARRAGDDNK